MLRLLLVITTLFTLSPCQSMAASSDRVQTARIFLANGNPDQAVRTAEKLLKKQSLSRGEQRELLRLIADAEYMRTTHQHFQQVDIAIHAIDALLHEFPALTQAAQYRWNRAWLWQQSGNNKQAMTTLREIIAKDQQPANLRRAWLMMARLHIRQRHYAYARSDLLQYGLQANEKSREQAVGMAWMAIVDKGEGRSDASYTNLATVFRHWPAVVGDQPLLYSTYIKLLRERNQNDQALHLSEDFIRRYIDTDLAADIRLIHADIMSENQTNIAAAIKEYGILSDSQAETGVGRRAFIRKLMLENRHENQRDKLLPVMIALKKVADSNQLSKLEDEAMLDLARLWTRISAPGHDNTGHAPALEAYAHAAISTDQRIARTAAREGATWLQSKLNAQMEAGHWLETVTIWRKYPQLQPAAGKAPDLEFSVAHAMRMLMLFDAAEEMLQNLYARNKTSIRGQQIMMEMAKLWMDRQDNDGVKKIMAWLNRNPLSIYRPEMMLIIARIRMNQKQPELARQMLAGVSADALATESRASFWLTQAGISAAMNQWHTAARNWRQYRESSGADQIQGLLNEANALFTASEFAEAYKQFMQVPDERRDAAWQYYVGRCQLNTGAVNQGTERLQSLAADKGAGRFATLAKLELANQQAGSLLGAKP